MSNYIVGLYGLIEFTAVKKKHGKTYENYFELMAEIIEVDNGNMLIRDNDDIVYLVEKKRVKQFVPREKLIET